MANVADLGGGSGDEDNKKISTSHYRLATSDDLLLCRTCGTQYDEIDRSALTSCRICTVRCLNPLYYLHRS